MSGMQFLSLARRILRRNWEVLLLFAVGNLLFTSLQLTGNTPESHSQYILIRRSIEILNILRENFMPVLLPLFWVAATCYLLLPLSIKWRRAFVDFFALWFILRIVDLFVLINLLIFLRSSDHALLIAQLLLFLPCLLLMWGWIYWRMDLWSNHHSGNKMFTFKVPDGTTPTVYDYFLVSFTSLISHTLSGFSGDTRIGRTLIFIHGVMMWDVMGLMLSRAIAMMSS